MKKFNLLRIVATVVIFTAASVIAMYFDARPIWMGLVIAGIMIACAGLIGGVNAGWITGALSTVGGIIVKSKYYFVPKKYLAFDRTEFLKTLDDTFTNLHNYFFNRSEFVAYTKESLKPIKSAFKSANFHAEADIFGKWLSDNLVIILACAVLIGVFAGLMRKRDVVGRAEFLDSVGDSTPLAPKAKKASQLFKRVFGVKNLVYMSMFIALAVAINTIRIGNISFSGFPIIFSGFALGPISGFLVGGIADFVGFVVRPSSSGGFNPLFTLTSALTGLIPGLMIMIPALAKRKHNFLVPLFIIFITQFSTSVIMVPFFRLWLFQHPLIATMTSAAIKQAYSVPLYAFLYIAIDKALGEKFNKKLFSRRRGRVKNQENN